MIILDTIVPTEEERRFALDSARRLAGTSELRLKIPAQRRIGSGKKIAAKAATDEIFVPARVSRGILQLLVELAKGNAITIVPMEAMLTTQDAADFLRVSRPFLIKLLEKEKVPIQKVGNRRKIAFPEVLKLKGKLTNQSDSALKELAELDAELGL